VNEQYLNLKPHQYTRALHILKAITVKAGMTQPYCKQQYILEVLTSEYSYFWFLFNWPFPDITLPWPMCHLSIKFWEYRL